MFFSLVNNYSNSPLEFNLNNKEDLSIPIKFKSTTTNTSYIEKIILNSNSINGSLKKYISLSNKNDNFLVVLNSNNEILILDLFKTYENELIVFNSANIIGNDIIIKDFYAFIDDNYIYLSYIYTENNIYNVNIIKFSLKRNDNNEFYKNNYYLADNYSFPTITKIYQEEENEEENGTTYPCINELGELLNICNNDRLVFIYTNNNLLKCYNFNFNNYGTSYINEVNFNYDNNFYIKDMKINPSGNILYLSYNYLNSDSLSNHLPFELYYINNNYISKIIEKTNSLNLNTLFNNNLIGDFDRIELDSITKVYIKNNIKYYNIFLNTNVSNKIVLIIKENKEENIFEYDIKLYNSDDYIIKTIKNSNKIVILSKISKDVYLINNFITGENNNFIENYLSDTDNFLNTESLSYLINNTNNISILVSENYDSSNLIPMFLKNEDNNKIYLLNISKFDKKITFTSSIYDNINNLIFIGNEIIYNKSSKSLYKIFNFNNNSILIETNNNNFIENKNINYDLDLINNNINIKYSTLLNLYNDKMINLNEDRLFNIYFWNNINKIISNSNEEYETIKFIKKDNFFVDSKFNQYCIGISLNNILEKLPNDTKYLNFTIKNNSIYLENIKMKITKTNSKINIESLNTNFQLLKIRKTDTTNYETINYLSNYYDCCKSGFNENYTYKEDLNFNIYNYFLVSKIDQSIKYMKNSNNRFIINNILKNNSINYNNQNFIYRIDLLINCKITNEDNTTYTSIYNNNDYFYYFNDDIFNLTTNYSINNRNLIADLVNFSPDEEFDLPENNFKLEKYSSIKLKYYTIDDNGIETIINDESNIGEIKYSSNNNLNIKNKIIVEDKDLPVLTNENLYISIITENNIAIINEDNNKKINFYFKNEDIKKLEFIDTNNDIIVPKIIEGLWSNSGSNKIYEFHILNYITNNDNENIILDQYYKYNIYDKNGNLIRSNADVINFPGSNDGSMKRILVTLENYQSGNDNISGLLNDINSFYNTNYTSTDLNNEDYYILELLIYKDLDHPNNNIKITKTFYFKNIKKDNVESNKFIKKVAGHTSYNFRNNVESDPITEDGTNMQNKYNNVILRLSDDNSNNDLSSSLVLNKVTIGKDNYYLDDKIDIFIDNIKDSDIKFTSYFNDLNNTRKTKFQYEFINGDDIKLNQDNIDINNKIELNYADNNKNTPIQSNINIFRCFDSTSLKDYITGKLITNSNIIENGKYIKYLYRTPSMTDSYLNNLSNWSLLTEGTILESDNLYFNFYNLVDSRYEFLVYANGRLIFDSMKIYGFSNKNDISKYNVKFNFLNSAKCYLYVIFKDKINYETYVKDYSYSFDRNNKDIDENLDTIRIYQKSSKISSDIYSYKTYNEETNDMITENYTVSNISDINSFIDSDYHTIIKYIPAVFDIECRFIKKVEIYINDYLYKKYEQKNRSFESFVELMTKGEEIELDKFSKTDYFKKRIDNFDKYNFFIKIIKYYYTDYNEIKKIYTNWNDNNIILTGDDNTDNITLEDYFIYRPSITKREKEEKIFYIDFFKDLKDKGIEFELDTEDTVVNVPKIKFLNDNMQFDYKFSIETDDNINIDFNSDYNFGYNNYNTYIFNNYPVDNYDYYINYLSINKAYINERNNIDNIKDKELYNFKINTKSDNYKKITYNSIPPKIPYLTNLENGNVLDLTSISKQNTFKFIIKDKDIEKYEYKIYINSLNFDNIKEYINFSTVPFYNFILSNNVPNGSPLTLILSVKDKQTGLYRFNSYNFSFNYIEKRSVVNYLDPYHSINNDSKRRNVLIPFSSKNEFFKYSNELVVNKETGDLYITSSIADENGNHSLIPLTSNITKEKYNLAKNNGTLSNKEVSLDELYSNFNNYYIKLLIVKKLIKNYYENYYNNFKNYYDTFVEVENYSDKLTLRLNDLENIKNKINLLLNNNTERYNEIINQETSNNNFETLNDNNELVNLSENDLNKIKNIIKLTESLKTKYKVTRIKNLIKGNIKKMYEIYSFMNELRFNLKRIEYESTFKVNYSDYENWKNSLNEKYNEVINNLKNEFNNN